ncbi:MAG: hypothetical protein GY755_22255 [Chloroflexi bacterium]|nr:hypothetical protein [Chloroflexota bacterium]
MITLLTIIIIIKKCISYRNDKQNDTCILKTVLPPKQITYNNSTKEITNVSNTTNTITQQKQSIEMLNQIWNSYPLSNENGDKCKKMDGNDSSDIHHTNTTVTIGEI